MADLKKLLPASRIISDLENQEIEEVIQEMLDFLITEGAVDAEEKENYLEAVLEREKQIGTGVGSGVAIPHARVHGLEKAVAAFARSKSGAKFDTPDNAPVHFVCLLLVPENQAGLHLQTLAALAKLLSRCEVRERLMVASSAEEISVILAD